MSDSTAEAGVDEVEEVEEEASEEIEYEAVSTVAEPETDETGDSDSEQEDGEEQEEDEVEMMDFDFGGNKLSVPKTSVPEELASEIEKFTKGTWSDYTKKSQAVSEAAKALEARESVVQKYEALNGEALDKYSEGLAVKKELEQLEQYDLGTLWQSDPDQARMLSDRISAKQAQFNSIISEVSQREAQLSEVKQQETARRLKEGEAYVERHIKGFSAKVPELMEYVTKTFNVPKEDAEMWAANPNGAIMAYESMMYRKLQAKVKTTGKPKLEKAVPVKAIKAKGKYQAKNLNQISDPEEYRKAWQAQQKRAE